MIRRSSLEKLAVWFDPKYWWYADIDLWIRLSVAGEVGCIHKPVLQKRVYEKGHYLEDKRWQASIVCDRIRLDNWKLVYPQSTLRALWALLQYTARKDLAGIRTVLRVLSDGNEDASPPTEALRYFSPLGRVIVGILQHVPRYAPRTLRTIFRRLHPQL